jgi:hypothetical protein
MIVYTAAGLLLLVAARPSRAVERSVRTFVPPAQ